MKPKITHDQIEDLIEFCISRQKPEIKTKRTTDEFLITVNRTKFRIKIERKRKNVSTD